MTFVPSDQWADWCNKLVDDHSFRECVSISATGSVPFQEVYSNPFWTRRMRHSWIQVYNEQQEEAMKDMPTPDGAPAPPPPLAPGQSRTTQQAQVISDADLASWAEGHKGVS